MRLNYILRVCINKKKECIIKKKLRTLKFCKNFSFTYVIKKETQRN